MQNSSKHVSEPWRVELLHGLEELRAGDFARAEKHFARAYQWAPERPEVCFALGRERLRRGDIDGAEELLRSAWDADRSLLSAGIELARCLGLHRADPGGARAVLDLVDAQHGPAAVIEITRGELFIEEDAIAAAREAAERALAMIPPDAAGGEQDETDDREDGTRAAARAILSRVENRAGIEQAAAGEPERALFSFKRAVDLDPEWSGPHVNTGAAFMSLGRPRRARAAYERALDLDPQNAVAHYNLALLWRELGELDRAAGTIEEAHRLDPDSADIRAALVDCFLERGDADRAVEICRAAVAREPGSSSAWTDLGTAHAGAADSEQAEDCLRRALELDPTHIVACCRLADILARQARYLEAALFAERAQALDPARAEAYLSHPPARRP